MSIIGVQVTDDFITLIGDTQVTQGLQKRNKSGYKMFTTKNAVVAIAGTAMFRPIIKSILDDNPLVDHSDDEILAIVDKLHEASATRGMSMSDEEGAAVAIIIASKNKASMIQGYTFDEITDFDALGTPEAVVRALVAVGIPLFEAVVQASSTDIYCSGPFEVMQINRETGEVLRDVLNERREVVEDSYGLLIDYSEPIDDDDDDVFDPSPEFTVTVVNKHGEELDWDPEEV